MDGISRRQSRVGRGSRLTNLGTYGVAEQIANLVDEIAKSKKNAHEKRRRLIAGIKALLPQAVVIGIDLSLIAVRENTEAVLTLAEVKRKLLHS